MKYEISYNICKNENILYMTDTRIYHRYNMMIIIYSLNINMHQ